MTEAKHTWPAHWIESARNAGLLFGGDATGGQMHVAHGMQYQLEQFARALTTAERKRIRALVEAVRDANRDSQDPDDCPIYTAAVQSAWTALLSGLEGPSA